MENGGALTLGLLGRAIGLGAAKLVDAKLELCNPAAIHWKNANEWDATGCDCLTKHSGFPNTKSKHGELADSLNEATELDDLTCTAD